VSTERNSTKQYLDIGLSGHSQARLATAAGLALDRMRALAAEADPAQQRVTTASALFALCDMARAKMFQGTRIFGLIEHALAGRWSRLATERARYIAGQAPELAEQPGSTTLVSANAARALSIAQLLAGEYVQARPLIVEDIVLGLLLCTPTADEPVAAHTVLRRLDLGPLQLLERWAELAPV
jgi:hypothetical protein